MKSDYIIHLIQKAGDFINNNLVQEIIFEKIDLIESIWRYNEDLDQIKLAEQSIADLKKILEYYHERLLERYKRRNLTPIQFAKEKQEKLKDSLTYWEEKLNKYKQQGNRDKEKITKTKIDRIKTLIDANKQRQELIKQKERS